MPGVKELMQKITESGILCCVVTGSAQRPLIQRIHQDFGAFVREEHVTTAYDVTRGKPAPDPYLMGLRKAGDLLPFQGIVVENAPLGVRAGHAAKIFTVAVNTGPLQPLVSKNHTTIVNQIYDKTDIKKIQPALSLIAFAG